MSPALAQREFVLAAVALLSIVLALALASVTRGSSDGDAAGTRPAAPGSDWYRALAAPYRLPTNPPRTACGHRANENTFGVAHPVLPCGAKITIAYEGKEVLTQVIDRGTGAPGRQFDVTQPLAARLGLRGVQPIRWRFAG